MATESTTPDSANPAPAEPEVAAGDAGGPAGIARKPLAWVALVLLLALIGTSVALVLSLTGPGEAGPDAQAEQAKAVARDYALALSNLDYRTVDESQARAAALTTAGFREPTSEIFTLFASTLAEAEAVTSGAADDVGLASIDDDSAVVLVFLDQTSTNLVHPDGQVTGHRLRVELVREDGQWLVNGAQFR